MTELELSPAIEAVSTDTLERCRVVGRMIDKDGCYALHREDFAVTWLEMDRIPLHLLDQEVEVEGILFRDFISVQMIGPSGR